MPNLLQQQVDAFKKKHTGTLYDGRQANLLIKEGGGSNPAGTIRFEGAGFMRRQGMSKNPLTEAEQNIIIGAGGNIWGNLSKAVQEKELTGQFGPQWQQTAQGQMTPLQKMEVATGRPTPVTRETGMPLGTPSATPLGTPAVASRTPVQGFPQNQAEHAAWQQKYDLVGGKWFEKSTTPTVPTAPVVPTGGANFPIQPTTGGVPTQPTTGYTPPALTGGETAYQKLLFDKITKLEEAISGQDSFQDIYKTGAESLGVPGLIEQQTGLQQQVLDVEGLLDKLEGDINTRTSGKLINEAQRRRYLATEGRPLREQLADLMRSESRAGAELSGARGQLSTMMSLEEKQRTAERQGLKDTLPLYKEAYAETPAQAFARSLQEEEAKKTAGVSPYYTKPTTPKVTTPTAAEKTTNAIAGYGSAFVPGAVMENGIPILDSEGFMTPEAWMAAIADAPNEGLTRKQFLAEFGHFIVSRGEVSRKYGLTQAEADFLGAFIKD